MAGAEEEGAAGSQAESLAGASEQAHVRARGLGEHVGVHEGVHEGEGVGPQHVGQQVGELRRACQRKGLGKGVEEFFIHKVDKWEREVWCTAAAWRCPVWRIQYALCLARNPAFLKRG
eukprot:1436755-Rhodomonas_salina.1